MFKKLILTLLSILMMLVLVAVAIPFFIPAEDFKNHVLEFAQAKLGRKITVEGPVEFALLPDIALRLEGVKVANAEGFTAPEFAQIGSVRLSLALWPLLDRQIIVQELALDAPQIYLEKGVGDAVNWDFKPASKGGQVDKPGQTATEAPSDMSPMQYNIGAIRIADGKLQYRTTEQLTELNSVNLDYSGEKLTLASDVSLQGTTLRPELEIRTPSNLLEGMAAPVSFTLKNAPMSLNFDGELSGVNINQQQFDWQLKGALKSEGDSLAAVQQKLTGKEGNACWQKPFSLNSADMRLNGQKLEMVTLQGWLDNTELSGRLAVAYGGKKPSIDGNFNLPLLDMDAWMGTPSASDASTESASTDSAPMGASSDWSKEPIDLSALNAVDANVTASIGEYRMQGLTLTDSQIKLALKSGKLNLTIPQTMLDSGSIAVEVVVDASQEVPQWSKQVTLKDIPFASLTKPYVEKTRLRGRTNGVLGFSGRGNSIHDWVNSLSGGGKLALTEGVIEGYSLARIFRNIRSAYQPEQSNETPFSRLFLDFTADNGVLNFSAMNLDSQILQASATGKVSLKAKNMDLYAKPKLVPKLDAKVTDEQAGGVLVPVRIYGPWNDISITPDLQAAIREAVTNPENLKNAAGVVREEGRAIRQEFKEQKEGLKESFQQLKENKDEKSLHDVLNAIKGLGGKKVEKKPATLPEPLPEPLQ